MQPDHFTVEELTNATGSFVFDVESFPNYFVVSFMHIDSKKIAFFECYDNEALSDENVRWLIWLMTSFCQVGFNSKNYDLPMVSYAVSKHKPTAKQLKDLSNDLIGNDLRPHAAYKKYGFYKLECNHIDIMPVAPLGESLKTYAARLKCQHLEDLPYHHETVLTLEQCNHVRNYNFADLENTRLVTLFQTEHLNLRAAFGVSYANHGSDFRSLSDAQMAEEIISCEMERVTGKRPKRTDFASMVGQKFNYKTPSCISYKTKELKQLLEDIENATFEIGDTGHIICPKSIDGRSITIGNNTYTVGIGGLHSVEKSVAHKSRPGARIVDRDVASYYPMLMLNNEYYPQQLGKDFLVAFGGIVERRLEAKANKDMITADGLKIAVNGSFGKTSNKYSILYDPRLMIQTTLSGQLGLLMIIEWLVEAGVNVISANTDGVVSIVTEDKEAIFAELWKKWGKVTNLKTEETEYKALYCKDVNNYIAIKMDGKAKQKGEYAFIGSAQQSPLSKNPESFVSIDAVLAHIIDGVPIEQTIHECKDFNRFISVEKVTCGAQKDGKYLGKTVRWYYAQGVKGFIQRTTNGNKVSLTDGAKPCMMLPDKMPSDIDYSVYANRAISILEDIGFQMRRNAQYSLLDN